MLIDLTQDLDKNLFGRVQELIDVTTGEKVSAEESDFWLDDDTVVFISSPEDDDIFAADYVELNGDLGYFAEFIDHDFIKTYLSTGDLVLIISSNDSGLEAVDARVAVADRSSGMALIHPKNLFDKSRLAEIAAVAQDNTISSDNLKSWESNYALVCRKGDEEQTKERDLSRNRLVSMLGDIEVHALSKYLGKQVRIIDHK